MEKNYQSELIHNIILNIVENAFSKIIKDSIVNNTITTSVKTIKMVPREIKKQA